MSSKSWSARYLLTLGLLLGMVAMGGSMDGREARRKVIKGRIVSVATEEPVAGAKVTIKGVGEAITNAGGRYKIRVAGDIAGLRQVVVRAAGHRRRKAWLSVPDSARKVRADWNVIPSSSPEFDSILFDQLTRLGSREVGTSRWEKVPVVRILTRALDCPGGSTDENCPEWIVSSAPVSNTLVEWFQIVAEDLPPLMGGIVPAVEIIDLPAGASIQPDRVLVPGAITLVPGTRGGFSFPRIGFGQAIGGIVYMGTFNNAFAPSDFLRQVAFGLGYPGSFVSTQLCLDLAGRGLRSVHCRVFGAEHPTALDAALGRALYTRPVGNRFPDTDPKPEMGTLR